MIITLTFLEQVFLCWRVCTYSHIMHTYIHSIGKDQRVSTQETTSKGKSAFLTKFYHFAYRQLHSKNSIKGIC